MRANLPQLDAWERWFKPQKFIFYVPSHPLGAYIHRSLTSITPERGVRPALHGPSCQHLGVGIPMLQNSIWGHSILSLTRQSGSSLNVRRSKDTHHHLLPLVMNVLPSQSITKGRDLGEHLPPLWKEIKGTVSSSPHSAPLCPPSLTLNPCPHGFESALNWASG